jgi:hypothetical protein
MTVVEMMLSVSLMTIISATMLESLVRFQEAGSAISQKYTLERRSSEVAMRITKDLGRSGYAVVDEQHFPMILPSSQGIQFVSVDGANHQSGESNELVFCLPADHDKDGWPDVNGSTPAWSESRISYHLLPSANNLNDLVREEQSGRKEILCRGVARFAMEDPNDTGFEIPLDSMRMTLTLSVNEGDQQFLKTTQEVIRLRNGGLAP